jgi:hypothetical protein
LFTTITRQLILKSYVIFKQGFITLTEAELPHQMTEAKLKEFIRINKEKQKRYVEDRFIYRQDHSNLSNQVMGRGLHLAGKK